jgi:hypothetical protein
MQCLKNRGETAGDDRRRTEIFDEIESRLVSPVDVFHDQDGGRSEKVVEESGKEHSAIGLAVEQCVELGSGLLGDVVERAKRAHRFWK